MLSEVTRIHVCLVLNNETLTGGGMRICGELITALTAALLLGTPVRAQGVDDAEWLERCRRENQRGDQERHCEVRELRMPASQLLRVQPSRNGGVRIDAGSG